MLGLVRWKNQLQHDMYKGRTSVRSDNFHIASQWYPAQINTIFHVKNNQQNLRNSVKELNCIYDIYRMLLDMDIVLHLA
jgi:hypothetical protein